MSDNAIQVAEARSNVRAIANTQLDSGAPRAIFLPSNMGEAMELARLMSASNFVPAHLRGKAGDCLAVVMQANRWAMDPFAVGNKTYFVNDRMAYESQLVNAVVNSAGVLEGRLKLEWKGDGNELVCTVTGFLKGDPDPKVRRVPIKNITTRNSPLWKQDPEQQLGYYASRAWARLYAPEVLLGVYTPDEMAQVRGTAGTAGDVREIKPLSAKMLASGGKPDPEETAAETANGPSEAEIKRQNAEKWITDYFSDLMKAEDRAEFTELEERSAKALAKLQTDHPDLYAQAIEACSARNDQIPDDPEPQREGRGDGQMGEAHNDDPFAETGEVA